MADSCPRDEVGFCRIALLSHPLCVPGEECKIADDAKDRALYEASDAAAQRARRATLSK